MTSDATVMSKPVFTREAVGHAAQGDDRVAQRAVVHVQDPAPGDPALVDASSLPQ
jgi:hypothetical protein